MNDTRLQKIISEILQIFLFTINKNKEFSKILKQQKP
jgi:hypothetical protein